MFLFRNKYKFVTQILFPIGRTENEDKVVTSQKTGKI